jgi:dipicolinate synthase subunit B
MSDLSGIRIGYVITGSFCTISESLAQMQALKNQGADIIPVISENTLMYDTRFQTANEIYQKATEISGKKPLTSIVETEPFGPRNYADILVVAPCTSNTLAKLANGINDTCATMAVKSHLRQNKPVVLAIATNDALGISSKNIGYVLNMKNYYLVPLIQDEPDLKPNSMVSDFCRISETICRSLRCEQIRPLIR